MRPTNILIVEDDIYISAGIKKKLKQYDYNISAVVQSGKEAIEKARKMLPDIILMDIKLEGEMDGIEAAKGIQEFLDVPVIYLTAYSDKEILNRASITNPFGYLIKPVNEKELHSAIEMALYRKAMEKDVKKQQVQLFQTSKLATLGEMSAGLAHEMNQPLGAISLILQIFRKLKKKNMLTDDELESGLFDIEESVLRMSKIITHIRTFARQDTNPQWTNIDIQEVVESTLNLLSEQLRLRNIEVKKEYSENIPLINAEQYQLEQVLINIIVNARDALDERGEQETNGYAKQLILNTLHVNKDICVRITDNGIGIPQQVKEKIFNPFFTTKEVGKGTGLGMSISHGIIESFKGRIEVESEQGRATSVSIFLPHVVKQVGLDSIQ